MAPAKPLPAPAGPRAVLGKRKKDDDDNDGGAAASGSRKRVSAAGPTKKRERIKALQALLKITDRTSEGRAIREAVTTCRHVLLYVTIGYIGSLELLNRPNLTLASRDSFCRLLLLSLLLASAFLSFIVTVAT